MKKKWNWLFVLLLLAVLFASIPAHAAKLKSYKASKVTAKQIAVQLKKVTNVGTTRNHEESGLTTGQINSYKSKFSYFDTKYNKTYCSIEVFADVPDAVHRHSYLSAMRLLYESFGTEETVPWNTFRYKNIIFRYPSEMPYKYAAIYYKYIKKIVK